MQKSNMIYNGLLATALVLGLGLAVIGAAVGDKASSVKPITSKMQLGQIQASKFHILTESAKQAFDEKAAYEAEEAVRLAELIAKKSASTVYVPPSPSDQRSTGDDCSDPIVLNLGSSDLPYTDFGQTTCGRGNNYNNTCLGDWDGGEDIIYELNLSENLVINISLDPKGAVYSGFLLDATCPADPSTCIAMSTRHNSDPHGVTNISLTAGTYYIMVDTWPPPNCLPDFDLTIEEFVISTGDDCNTPVVVKLPDDLTGGPNNDSYIDENHTCGRGNDYDNTCLEEEYNFDGGEDIIYKLDVSTTVTVDIFLDPGTSNWTGILIDDNCPPDETGCIQYSTIGTGAHGVYDVTLEPGIYYIMVDTWPSPTCIPLSTLTIRSVDDRLENDAWENCIAIDDVVNLAFSTKQATPDGPGGCLTSPTIWYCYTSTCTGTAIISLCGSSYNTKLAVWDGISPYYDPMLGCNDASDSCGELSQQSQLEIEAVEGNTYLVGIGGWGDHTGDGILNITCATPPENDNCEDVTPVTLTNGVPVTFTGDNTNASHQCDLFEGPHTWHAFTLDTTMNVTLDYCSTDPAFGNAWLNLAIGCPCTGISSTGEFDGETCGDGNLTITWEALEVGTYYYPVLRGEGAIGPYTLHVVGEAVAVYCSASGGCNIEYISRVVVGSIDNSSGCDNYGDYTSLSTTMEAGLSYPITIELGSGISGDIGVVRVDWNQDTVFQISEEVALDVSTGQGPYTGFIIPPENAINGPTRMRIRLGYNSYPLPCGVTADGEVEDYTINVEGGGCCVQRGDINHDGSLDITDLTFLVDYFFSGGAAPPCLEEADVNGDGNLDISDLTYLVDYLFGGGPAPVPC